MDTYYKILRALTIGVILGYALHFSYEMGYQRGMKDVAEAIVRKISEAPIVQTSGVGCGTNVVAAKGNVSVTCDNGGSK